MITTQMRLTDTGLKFENLDDDLKTIIRESFKPGELLDCDIRRHAGGRSAEQQGLFHELVKRYAAQMHEPFHVVKWRWKWNYGPSVTWEGAQVDGPPVGEAWRGAEWVKVQDIYPTMVGTFVCLKSEGRYTTKESADAITGAMQECVENNVEIADIVRTLADNERRRAK